MYPSCIIAVFLIVALGLSSCNPKEPTEDPEIVQEEEKLHVMVSFYPTYFFVERLASPWVHLECVTPESEDPLLWEPDRGHIRDLLQADLVLLNGAGLEQWKNRVSIPYSRCFETAQGFAEDWIEFDSAIRHAHGDQAEHKHDGVDPHTWLDPKLALQQAEAVSEALLRYLPSRAGEIEQNMSRLERELLDLLEGYRRLGAVVEGQFLYASHPAYNYLARRLDWPVVNLDLDPSENPSAEQIASIRASLLEKPGRFVLWESMPSAMVQETMERSLGLKSVVVSPTEMLSAKERAEGKDYLTMQKQNLLNLRLIFTP